MAIETTIAAGTVRTTFSFILSVLLPSLRSELGLLTGFKSESKKLESLYTRIQSVLEDAMRRDLNDRSLQDWLEKLLEVTYHADNVLDKFKFEVLRLKTASRDGHCREVCDFFSRNNQLKFRISMAHKMKNLREKIDSFAEEVSKVNLGPVAAPRPTRNPDERATHSFAESSEVMGRHEDMERLVEVLRRARATTGNLSVVAIVGVGGVGKTTLAKLVCNDNRLSTHFDLKIWISVSDNFVLRQLLISIIESAREENCAADGLDTLQRKVRKELRGKKYLLVLDDVWNEEQSKWEELEEVLRCGAPGSKILVTTRSLKVPSIMGSSHELPLKPLPDDICWDLFRKRAFEVRETPSENLIASGREIVKKCKGIPLAAQALGSLLRFKRNIADWRLVEESEVWQLFKSETDELMPVLRLSYDHLSFEAKQCFAFCSLFPKGYEMEKETLIRQWTCNGFVLNEWGQKGGHEVFNDLLWRSFFLDTRKDEFGQTRCRLHDLMHDLAQLVAGKQFCSVTGDTGEDTVNERTYHLFIHEWSSDFPTIQETKNAKYLRTLLAPRCDPIEKSSLKIIFAELRYLRVLDLSRSEIKVIPDSVSCLIHLRYLDLSSSAIELLPESISYLLNLQVLKLRSTKLQKLPKSLKKLVSLKHLDIRSCLMLTDMPAGMGRLTNLQTLTDFKVGAKKTSCALQELKDLRLSGELFIWHLENFKTKPTEIQQTILSNKEDLVSLRLEWYHRNNSASNDEIERALDLLKPHQNLERLQLHNYRGLNFPPWLSEPLLPNLVEIKLVCCTNCEHLPAFGSIASLKDLQIIGMHKVRQISRELYGTGLVEVFPSLENFALFDMPKLQDWLVFDGMAFPQLKVLTIGKCRALTSIPLIQSLQTLEISHCSSSLLASLPSSLNLPALSSLVIDNIQEWTSLPDGSLLSLRSLRKLLVSYCHQLKNLPLDDMQQLVTLQSLQISYCLELESLNFDASQMTCLRSLNIINCTSLISLPQNWTGITSLQSISIVECRNVTSWTEPEIKGLSSISDFTLEICNNKVNLSGLFSHITNLETLTFHWKHAYLNPKPSKLITGNSITVCCCGDRLGSLLHNLSNATSLKHLVLKNIPDTTLPHSIGEIQSLRYLSIYNCPQLASLPNNLRELTRLEVMTQGCPMLESQLRDAAQTSREAEM